MVTPRNPPRCVSTPRSNEEIYLLRDYRPTYELDNCFFFKETISTWKLSVRYLNTTAHTHVLHQHTYAAHARSLSVQAVRRLMTQNLRGEMTPSKNFRQRIFGSSGKASSVLPVFIFCVCLSVLFFVLCFFFRLFLIGL